jgi:hypothetical protein
LANHSPLQLDADIGALVALDAEEWMEYYPENVIEDELLRR